MLVGLIVACEAGFWVLLAAGLVARYGLRMPRLGAALLVCVPVVDLVLLVATVIDLRGGAVAGTEHALAALYLGFSVVFGHRMIKATDVRVAHRFAGGPAPVPPPRSGRARVDHEWSQWRRAVGVWAISSTLLGAAVLAVGDPARTAELTEWIGGLSIGVAAWLLLGPLLATARVALQAHRPGAERT